MAKVTQQDVVNFLKEKVTQLTKDLESAQNALSALQGSIATEAPVKRGRKPKAERTAPAAKRKTAKAGGAKRGRKPKAAETPVEHVPEHE
jgi:hypothetical protein